MNSNTLINVLAPVTLFEMMVAIGLGVTVSDVASVARRWRLLAFAALANYVCVPAAAVALLLLFKPHSLDPTNFPMVAAGFLIAAVCPGAPYGPPFTGIAKGNVVLAVGLMVMLAGSSALVAPLLLRLLLPLVSGSQNVEVNALKMVGTLLMAQFLPLCIGLAVRQWWPLLADRLKKPANRLSMVLNLTTLVVIVSAQFEMLMGITPKAFGGMLALVLPSVAAGWLLGGPGRDNRTAMSMATSVRNVGVSLVIATASFPGTRAVTAATAFAIFQTILMALVALAWGWLAFAPARREKTPVAAEGVAGGTAS
jgi:BASS family bile acid:Na+ symporter